MKLKVKCSHLFILLSILLLFYIRKTSRRIYKNVERTVPLLEQVSVALKTHSSCEVSNLMTMQIFLDSVFENCKIIITIGGG